MSSSKEIPLEIDVRAVKSLLDGDEEFLLLDCREPQETALVKLEGATLIPMGEIQERLSELEPARQGRSVVYCHLGDRSLQVAAWLRQQGFDSAQSMAGGIDGWSAEIDPGLARY